MKRIFYILAIAALAFASCQKQPGSTEPTTDPTTDQYDPRCEEMPIPWTDNKADGTDVGVTIEVTKVENENFVFELRPGAKVQSYVLDVFPLSLLYNSLLDAGYLGKSQWEITEKIREYLFSSAGNGGYSFSVKDGTLDEFLQKEFDWANTAYASNSAIPVPDADYIIAVVACTETEASLSSQEQLTLCRVHTTSSPLVGNPSCDIRVEAGYTKFAVQHLPNADCKYIYYYGTIAKYFDDYIDAFGDRMFRDFLRSTTKEPYDTSVEANMIYNYSAGEYADASVMNCTAVICLDENKTPAPMYQRRDFNFKPIPANAQGADATLTIPQDMIAANYFHIHATMEANCNTIFYIVYTKGQYEALKLVTDAERAIEASLVYKGGFGCHNPNFKFDTEEEVPCGSQGSAVLPMYGDYISGETYVVGYICRNGYGKISELRFTEEFTLDERNLQSPDNCKVKDFKLKLSDPSRQRFNVSVEYDPATVSMVYLSFYYDGNEPPCKDGTWKDWMDFIFTPTEFGTGGTSPINHNISTWYRTESGYDNLYLTGLEPGKEYTVFACAEDFDGNVSEMQFQTISTEAIIPGPNPTMEVTMGPSPLDDNGWAAYFSIVKDVSSFKYALVDNITDIATYLPGVTEADLGNLPASKFSYDKCKEAFYNFAIDLGLSTVSDTSLTWTGNDTIIAVCVAIGADENGDEVYSKPYILVCKDGKGITLEDLYGVK